MHPERKRIEFLDTIRGLAALAVLLSHSFIFAWPDRVSWFVNLPFTNLFFNGKQAVAMFFVLSGFVLSRPFCGSEGPVRTINLPAFYVKRFTRIWLPWFFAFCLSALAQVYLFRPWTTSIPITDWADQFWHVPMTLKNFFLQCLFLQHDAKVQLLNQDWSLGIELKASVLLPVFVFLVPGRRIIGLLAAAATLFVFKSTGICYVSFILGVLLARFNKFPVDWLRARSEKIRIGFFFLSLLVYQSFQLFGPTNSSWVVTSVGCVMILIASLSSRRLQALLEKRPLVFLGKISYSVYLLQFITILCVLPAWVHLLNLLGFRQVYVLLPLTLLASVSVTILMSALSYRFVEVPCISLGSWLSKKFSRNSKTAPVRPAVT
ncbi:MAG TPA: acyltransferase [Candidatus Sulfotelmatobacter sp.]|jgi:peptidoglycan/LPS O-acetylase OafA/YrhL|nr:acyltransferase [Candidatus Sulfotelmatobacter sp.]